MSAVADGYDVYALLDASGTWSDLLRLTAIDQMRQAGVTITSGAAAFVEMLHDNASPIAGQLYAALDLPATRYILQITQGGKSAELTRLLADGFVKTPAVAALLAAASSATGSRCVSAIQNDLRRQLL